MELPSDDYLARLAFKQGEFERLDAAFARQLDQFSAFLAPAVETRLREQATGDVTEQWAETVNLVANGLLEDVAAWPDAAAGAQDMLRETLSKAVSRTDWPSTEDLKEEAMLCSREVGHSVLARWFEIVQAEMVSACELWLTPNVLPEGMTLQAAFNILDLESAGVDDMTLVAGWRAYWELLTRRFRQDWSPVDLGSLYLVPERSGVVDGYRLFTAEASAWAHAVRLREDEAAEKLRKRKPLAEVVAAMAGKLRSGVGIPISAASGILAMQDAWGRVLGGGLPTESRSQMQEAAVHALAASIVGAADDAPQRLLADIVQEGLDGLLAHGEVDKDMPTEELLGLLTTSKGALHEALSAYAGSRKLNIAEAADVYTVTVAGNWAQAVDAEMGILDPGSVLPATSARSYGKALADATALSFLLGNGAVQLRQFRTAGSDGASGVGYSDFQISS